MTDSQKPLIYRYLFIIILLLAVYGNTLNHGFVWDDHEIIVLNPLLQDLGNIPRFFLMEDVAAGPTGYYRPITYISFTLDRAIWGLNPVGFNITNLILHILATLLFYRLVYALFRNERLALYSALIFSLHPIVGESVNFHAGGRNTLLCACFALASLHSYVNEKRLRSLLFFGLAIFSKEFALLLPALFLLHDTTSKKRKNWAGYLPYLIAIAIYISLRSAAVAQGNLFKSINIAENFWIVPQTIISYLKIMIAPINLKTLYDVNNQITWSSFITYSLLLLAIVVIAAVFRKKTEILFGIAMFLLFLLPVTNLFPLGTTMMADRYAYFSLLGFSLVLAYCICLTKKKIGVIIMVLLCTFFISIDVKRNGYWKDEITFFTQMTKDAPEVFVGFMNLGYTYFNLRDYANAEKNLVAIQGKKDVTSKFLTNAAWALWGMDRSEKAISLVNDAIAIDRDYYQAYVMASALYEEIGKNELARLYREKVTAFSPRISEIMRQKTLSAYRNAQARMAEGHFAKAKLALNEALSYDPLFVPALIDMGSLAARKGDKIIALRYFRTAAVLDPLNPAVYYILSAAYDALDKKSESINAMNRFKELSAKTGTPTTTHPILQPITSKH